MQGEGSIIFLVLVGLVFYLMLYRPNKKRIDQHRKLIESVREGDDIVTIGGMFGSVSSIGEDNFHIEIAPGTTIKLAKSAVARRLEPDVSAEDEDAGTVEESQA